MTVKNRKTKSPLPTSKSTGFLIRDTTMKLQKVLRANLQKHNISTAQWYLLRVLWDEEGLSQRELSDRVATTEPTTQSALLRMEKQGVIVRKKNENDKRANTIHLTKKGRNLETALVSYAVDVNKIATAGLTKSEIKSFQNLINKIRQNLGESIN